MSLTNSDKTKRMDLQGTMELVQDVARRFNSERIGNIGNQNVKQYVDAHIQDTNNPHNVTKSQVGLGNVEDKSSSDIRGELTSANVTSALGYTPINQNEKGANSGVATLGADGKVPSSQLPSYVDDIIELLTMSTTAPATCAKGDWYFNTSDNKLYKATAANTWGVTAYNPEKGKIYFSKADEKYYRWGGSAMREVLSSEVSGIKVGSSGSTLTPVNGVVTIPAYEEGAQVNTITGVKGDSETDYRTGDVNITPANIGLGNVDNTADADKDVAHAENADKALNIFGSTQTNDIFVYRPTAGIQDIQSGEPGLGGAEVQKIEGNGVVWNQIQPIPQSNNGEKKGLTFTNNQDGSFSVSGTSTDFVEFRAINDLSIINSHKYLFMGCPKGGSDETYYIMVWKNSAVEVVGKDSGNGLIFTLDSNDTDISAYITFEQSGIVAQNEKFYFNLFDLTLIFGAGNEPSTVAEFETWLSNNIGLKDYYPYNAGELIGVKTISVKTTGFNQWDEVWEYAYYPNGVREVSTMSIGGVNLINVYSGETYYFRGGTEFFISYYNSNAQYIQNHPDYNDDGRVAIYPGDSITIPGGVRFIRISNYNPSGNPYNHDFCINLHHSGDRDGEYEPYWSETKQIPITTITGKLNGQGNSVTVFPDGMKSVGSVRDEIKVEGNVVKAIKRIGSVDMGSLSWDLADQNRFYSPSLYNYLPLYDSSVKANVICAIMCTVTDSSLHWNTDIEGIAVGADNYIYIRESSFNGKTGTEVKSLLSGVILFYELATPEEYVLDNFTMPVDYSVDDWGTEELLLGNTSSIVSCAPKMSIKYGINAADAIKNLPHNYVSVKQQTLSSTEKVQARQNIGACAEDDSRLSDARVASNMIADYTEVSSNTSGVTTSLTQDGSETKVYYNSGNAAVTVSFATSGLVFTDGNDSMEIPAGGYGEVNFLRVTTGNTTRVFVRSIVSE